MSEFKNTFAPVCIRPYLTTNQVIRLLFHQVVKYSELPNDVKKAVDYQMIK